MIFSEDSTISNKTILAEHVAEVCRAFEKEKGELHFQYKDDPLSILILTLLSHNTNDKNRDQAFKAMMKAFPTWKELHEASPHDLAQVIRPAGLNNQKAARIQQLLGYLKESEGDYTADFLENMSFEESVKRLGHLKGIGLKTLAVVMSFALGVDVFPVDTHVHRLCKRLGFVPENYSAVKTFNTMRNLVPKGKSYQFHLHLINHGRQICHARKPDCKACFVRDLCQHYLMN